MGKNDKAVEETIRKAREVAANGLKNSRKQQDTKKDGK